MPKKTDLFFEKEILQEYNLEEDSKIIWANSIENKEYTNNFINYKFLKNRMTNFSLYSSIFQQKHEERIKASQKRINHSREYSYEKKSSSKFNFDEEIDLFIYNLEANDCLFFGGVNIFNEYMRESPQIHLSSAYTFNKRIHQIKEDNNNNKVNNIILYINEDKVKELFNKINLLNKERYKFLLSKLKPLNEIILENIRFFMSTIKLIYINVDDKKDLINDKNIFYLVYSGSCWEKKKKDIIFDQGSFIGLNNIFLNSKNNNFSKITLYSKSSNVILFKIDLNYLSINNQEKIKQFLEKIFYEQYSARTFYFNKIISFENKKIEEKEKSFENKINHYIFSNSIEELLNKKDNESIISEKFQNINKKNEKSLKNIYLNKNKNIYEIIKRKKAINSFREIFTNGTKFNNLKKNENKSISVSNRQSNSNLPYVNIFNNFEKVLINNDNNKNPMNIIPIKKYLTQRAFPKSKNNNNEKINCDKRNYNTFANNKNTGSIYSSYSESFFNKNENILNKKRKNQFFKTSFLINLNKIKNDGINIFGI